MPIKINDFIHNYINNAIYSIINFVFYYSHNRMFPSFMLGVLLATKFQAFYFVITYHISYYQMNACRLRANEKKQCKLCTAL